jgi:hypothetical protein
VTLAGDVADILGRLGRSGTVARGVAAGDCGAVVVAGEMVCACAEIAKDDIAVPAIKTPIKTITA